MPVLEGVVIAVVMLAGVVAREWRRVELARERRREHEQEMLAKMVVEVAVGEREVQVHHGGPAGTWSLTGTARAGNAARGPAASRRSVGGRTAAARRRR